MSDENTVKILLAESGLEPTGDDLAYFVNTYPILRGMVEVLYSVEAARYESPGIVFDPAPRFVDWA